MTEASDKNRALHIAVMGVTGSGKSTFIKKATGQNVPIARGLESCEQSTSILRQDGLIYDQVQPK